MIPQAVLDLAVKLQDWLPKPLKRVLPVNTGAESNEAALRLAKLATGGYEVVALVGADLDCDNLADLRVETRPIDLTDERSVLQALEGGELLVHNAAVFPRTPAGEVSPTAWDAVFAVNLRGPFLLTRALLPQLRKRGGDAGVLFLGDAFAGELWPGYLPYCLSKLALPPLVAGLRKALPPDVRVGVIRPGLVLPPDRFPAERWKRLRASMAGRRGIRTPEGVARAVLQFARAKL